VIGTLNEGALHAQLKQWYREPGDVLEEKVDGYVVDLVRGELLVEFQTGGFAPLRRKLATLADAHAVRLVAPVAVTRRIIAFRKKARCSRHAARPGAGASTTSSTGSSASRRSSRIRTSSSRCSSPIRTS
jgi:hypothetical protein